MNTSKKPMTIISRSGFVGSNMTNPEELAAHERREREVSETTRQAVLERDENQCRSCGLGGEGRLQLHHVVYRSHGGSHESENLVTLCFDCHADVHAAVLFPAWVEWVDGEFCWFFKRLRPPKRWMGKR
jgi:hypothetical protein